MRAASSFRTPSRIQNKIHSLNPRVGLSIRERWPSFLPVFSGVKNTLTKTETNVKQDRKRKRKREREKERERERERKRER